MVEIVDFINRHVRRVFRGTLERYGWYRVEVTIHVPRGAKSYRIIYTTSGAGERRNSGSRYIGTDPRYLADSVSKTIEHILSGTPALDIYYDYKTAILQSLYMYQQRGIINPIMILIDIGSPATYPVSMTLKIDECRLTKKDLCVYMRFSYTPPRI